MKIVIGLPAFNEEKNIGSLLARLMQEYDSVIVCDDGSSDMTAAIAQKMGAIVISHQRNRGYGTAIQSLFNKAKEIDCDILVTFDADGQHKVGDIKKVIEPILKGNADVVIGSRFMDKNEKDVPKYREIGIKVITNLVNVESGKKITDAQSGFRAYNKKALLEIIPSDSGMGVSTEILIKANQKKLRIAEVPITILYDGDTSTHHPVAHGTSVMFSTMKFISIEHPLKFYGVPGIIFLAIGLFFVVWTIQEFTEKGRIITNISLIGIGLIIFGMMLMTNALTLYSLVNVVRERRP